MKTSKYHKAIIYDTVSIVEIANRLGLEKQRNSNYICVNSLHNEKVASMGIDDKKGLFHCFGCGVAGKHIKLVEYAKNCSEQDAINWIIDVFNIDVNTNTKNTKKSYKRKLEVDKWRAENGYISHTKN